MTRSGQAALIALLCVFCCGAAPDTLYTETMLNGGVPVALTQALTGNDDPEVVSNQSASNSRVWYAPANPGARLPPTATLAPPAGFKYAYALTILTNGTPLLVTGTAAFNAASDLQGAVWIGSGFTPTLLPNFPDAPYLGTSQRARGAGVYQGPGSGANFVLVAGNATGANAKKPTSGITNASFWIFPATPALAVDGTPSLPIALETVGGRFGFTDRSNYVGGVVNAPYDATLAPVVFGYSEPVGTTLIPVLWDLAGLDPAIGATTPTDPDPIRLDTPVLALLPSPAPFAITAAQVRGYSVKAGAWCLDLDCKAANIYGEAILVGSVTYQPTGSTATSSIGVIWYYLRGSGVAALLVPPSTAITTGSGAGALTPANQVLTLNGVNSNGQAVGQQIQRKPAGYAGVIADGLFAPAVPSFLTGDISSNRVLAPYAQVVDASAINDGGQIIATVNNGNYTYSGFGAILTELK